MPEHEASHDKPHLASPSGGLPSAVTWAHLLLADRLQPGDFAVDATAGNGHDTLFLCQQVLPGGHVFAFDVQARALANTRQRLLDSAVPASGFTLLHAGHETLATSLPENTRGQLAAAMFNLGYLPGADKSLITRAPTTLAAVRQALDWLRVGGLMTVVVYPGHAGGADEARAIAEWAASLDPRQCEVQHLRPVNRAAAPPECWAFRRSPD